MNLKPLIVLASARAGMTFGVAAITVLIWGCAITPFEFVPKPDDRVVAQIRGCGAVRVSADTIITAEHCLKPEYDVLVARKAADLALIRDSELPVPIVPLGDAVSDYVGLQHYAHLRYHKTWAIVVQRKYENGVDQLALVGEHEIDSGASGGGVFNEDGELVGVISSIVISTGVGWAIGPGAIHKLLWDVRNVR